MNDGDSVIWRYVDDYSIEYDDSNKWQEAEDAEPNASWVGGGSSPNPKPKPDPVVTPVKSPDYIKTAIKDGKIEIQVEDKVTGKMKPALIEHSESIGGYLIVQIGDQGEGTTSIELSPGDTQVVVLDNDNPYSYFDIGIDTAAIKEWEVKFSAPLLNEPENFVKITVQDATGDKVDVVVTLSEDGTTVIITPDIPYEKGDLYYITITDVVAADGKTQNKSIRKIFIVE